MLDSQTMWATEGPLKDVTDGGVACFIKLKIELGFVILNHNAFKVSYVGQSQQCSLCFSWYHRVGQCNRRNENRKDLIHEYNAKWKRQVNFVELTDMPLRPTPLVDKDKPTAAESERSVEEDSTRTTPPNTPARNLGGRNGTITIGEGGGGLNITTIQRGSDNT